MFNNMKSKIRLKTGEDVPEFNPQSSRTHSFHGSQSSLSSITSELNPTQSQMPNKIFDKDASELARINPLDLASKFKKEFRACEQEWLKKEKHYESRLVQANKDLQESISSCESANKRLEKCQNEKSDLEKHQLQEITKVKSLLLEKETENESLRDRLKVAEEKNIRMGDELMKLRPLEEKIESCRNDDKRVDEEVNRDEVSSSKENAEKENANLASEASKLRQLLSQKTNQLNELRSSELKNLMEKYENASVEFKSVVVDYSELCDQLAAIQDENERLKLAIEKCRNCEKLKKRMKHAAKEHGERQKAKAKNTAEANLLGELYDESTNEHHILRAYLQQLHSQLETYKIKTSIIGRLLMTLLDAWLHISFAEEERAKNNARSEFEIEFQREMLLLTYAKCERSYRDVKYLVDEFEQTKVKKNEIAENREATKCDVIETKEEIDDASIAELVKSSLAQSELIEKEAYNVMKRVAKIFSHILRKAHLLDDEVRDANGSLNTEVDIQGDSIRFLSGNINAQLKGLLVIIEKYFTSKKCELREDIKRLEIALNDERNDSSLNGINDNYEEMNNDRIVEFENGLGDAGSDILRMEKELDDGAIGMPNFEFDDIELEDEDPSGDNDCKVHKPSITELGQYMIRSELATEQIRALHKVVDEKLAEIVRLEDDITDNDRKINNSKNSIANVDTPKKKLSLSKKIQLRQHTPKDAEQSAFEKEKGIKDNWNSAEIGDDTQKIRNNIEKESSEIKKLQVYQLTSSKDAEQNAFEKDNWNPAEIGDDTQKIRNNIEKESCEIKELRDEIERKTRELDLIKSSFEEKYNILKKDGECKRILIEKFKEQIEDHKCEILGVSTGENATSTYRAQVERMLQAEESESDSHNWEDANISCCDVVNENADISETEKKQKLAKVSDDNRKGKEVEKQTCDDCEVHFEYMKKVIYRFITGSHEEAYQLLRALTTVLRATPKEEATIRDTLKIKSSWFGYPFSPKSK